MNFKKIKFNSKDKTLELSYAQYNDHFSNDIVNKCGQIVHTDLIDSINALKYHFAYLCDLREVDKIAPSDERIERLCEHTALNEVSVQSVAFTSVGDDDAVMLCGSKRFNGKYINVNSPITPLNADGYIHYWELQKALEVLQEEARMYLYEHKWGVEQAEFDFGMAAEFEDTPAIEPASAPTPPKRGRKPKVQHDNQPLVS